MPKDINTERVHNQYTDLKEFDNKIDESILDAVRLNKAIDSVWNNAINKGHGFLFDPANFISTHKSPSIEEMVLTSTCYRDAKVLSGGFNLYSNPCLELNQILIAAYEINFYTHNVDNFLESLHQNHFNQLITSLSIGSDTPKTIEQATAQSSAFFDKATSISNESVMALYEKRFSTLKSFGIKTVEQYISTMESGFCDLSEDIEMFSVNDSPTIKHYLSGLRLLSTYGYSTDAIKHAEATPPERHNEILLTSTATLSTLVKASQLNHSAARFNNLILDSGFFYVKKASKSDSNSYELPYSAQTSFYSWR